MPRAKHRDGALSDASAAIGGRLAELGDELADEGAAQDGASFTDLAAADELIRSSPEAFLIGVLFTQGVPAERAWAGPYLLQQRLGHLDIERLADERAAVAAAVAQPPALHRFKHTLGGWISDTAALLRSRYDGSASAVWSDRPTSTELTARLREFPGIGRKKAAMAVELLVRCFGVDVRGLERGTVAYDVHVRRVFLRAGLIDADTPEQVDRAAALAYPTCPSRVDLPAWLIGRRWCRPSDPDCDSCWLADECPRLVDRGVEGVGVRPERASGRRSRRR